MGKATRWKEEMDRRTNWKKREEKNAYSNIVLNDSHVVLDLLHTVATFPQLLQPVTYREIWGEDRGRAPQKKGRWVERRLVLRRVTYCNIWTVCENGRRGPWKKCRCIEWWLAPWCIPPHWTWWAESYIWREREKRRRKG